MRCFILDSRCDCIEWRCLMYLIAVTVASFTLCEAIALRFCLPCIRGLLLLYVCFVKDPEQNVVLRCSKITWDLWLRSLRWMRLLFVGMYLAWMMGDMTLNLKVVVPTGTFIVLVTSLWSFVQTPSLRSWVLEEDERSWTDTGFLLPREMHHRDTAVSQLSKSVHYADCELHYRILRGPDFWLFDACMLREALWSHSCKFLRVRIPGIRTYVYWWSISQDCLQWLAHCKHQHLGGSCESRSRVERLLRNLRPWRNLSWWVLSPHIQFVLRRYDRRLSIAV